MMRGELPVSGLDVLARKIGHEFIADASPDDLGLFDELMANAGSIARKSSSADAPFGTGLLEGMLIGIIYPLAQDLLKDLIEKGFSIVLDRARSLLEHGQMAGAQPAAISLSNNQQAVFAGEVERLATARGLTAAQSKALRRATSKILGIDGPV